VNGPASPGPDHVPGIEAARAGIRTGDPTGYRGVCECGWKGTVRVAGRSPGAARDKARSDALVHATGHRPAEKPKRKRDTGTSGY
jgi:hypothetical protein